MSSNPQQQQRKQKDVMDLEKYLEKRIHVKFMGGREVIGTLKGYDQLMNIVLDETYETLPSTTSAATDGTTVTTENKRYLGLLVCRGTTITVVCPDEGFFEETSNPFLAGGEEEEQ